MTPKYWVRIVLGILVIFAIGYGAKTAFHKGKTFVVDKFPPSLMLMSDAGFNLNGDKEGDIRRLQFMRSTPGHVDSAIITVKFSSDEDISQLKDCVLRVINGHPFSHNTRFECASADDSARLALVPFGHVTVEPEGTDVPLYISQRDAGGVQSDAYRGAGGDSGNVDINATGDNFSITVDGKQLVKINGDSNGGSFTVRDRNGKTIVDLHGHGNNAVINIHGAASRKDSSTDH
ncbi:MAG TPA: hypothetical protein VGM77_00755 [Gemmatimonadales bacterium]|jgi:hypothetical protein